jgi:predicted metal-dependent peptidase
MNEQARQALTRARAVLILDQPFFGTLALRLALAEDERIPTAAVDGRTLFYNPAFLLGLPAPQRLTLVAHEVMHCVLDHIGRCGGRAPARWGRAADHAANLLLAASGFSPIDGWLCDARYAGMSAEHIYTLLPDDPPQGGAPGPGADGGALDELRAPPTPGGGAADAAARAVLAREWTVATIQAASAAKAAGKLPSHLEALAEQVKDPQVDWRTLLRRFATERCAEDYSWTRPNKRMLVHGLYLPSLHTEALGALDVAVDTSGSMWDRPTLDAMAAELEAIVAEVRPRRVRVLYCDCAVRRVDLIEPGMPFHFRAKGGGGTAFAPVFDWVAAREEQGEPAPAALVYLTDLEGPLGFAPPPYPVLWCSTNAKVAPWGETLRIVI